MQIFAIFADRPSSAKILNGKKINQDGIDDVIMWYVDANWYPCEQDGSLQSVYHESNVCPVNGCCKTDLLLCIHNTNEPVRDTLKLSKSSSAVVNPSVQQASFSSAAICSLDTLVIVKASTQKSRPFCTSLLRFAALCRSVSFLWYTCIWGVAIIW